MERKRTLIIGLDGATLDLIRPWAQAGHLPAMARLMAEGVHGTLLSWPNLNSAAAWTSMVTGCNAGQHGIYGFGHVAAQEAPTWRPVTVADRKQEPFWHLLSAAGQRVGVINVPVTYPAAAVNGFMLAGSDASGVRRAGLAFPPQLLDKVRASGIEYVLDVPNLARLARQAPHQVPRPLQQMVDARSRTILHLMSSQPWDVLIAIFVATDRVQHYFWPPEAVPADDAAWSPIRRIYQQIDAFLHDALALAGQDTTVLVVSDHGFGPQRPVLHHVNELLAQLGLLRFREGNPLPATSALKKLLLLGRKWIPAQLQGPLARSFRGLHLRAMSGSLMPPIDWSQTQAFISPFAGQLYINLQGRQKQGIVSPQAYQPLCDRLRGILRELRDPSTGQRVVHAVCAREDVYHGPYADRAGDLIIRWEDHMGGDALTYDAQGQSIIVRAPKDGVVEGRGTGWSGTHRVAGSFLAWGPGIKHGAGVEGVTGYDIAPTILYLQHHPVPIHMDGQVLTDIFIQSPVSRQVGHAAGSSS